MTQIKKSIQLLIIVAIFSLMATYFVSVNIEQRFFSLNSNWISNEFVLACVGGIFASALILIVTEIQKYFREKRTVEHFLFNQIVFIYGKLNFLRKDILDIVSSNNYEGVNINYLSHITNVLMQNSEHFRMTDYNTFLHCRKNKREIIKNISTQLVSEFQETISVFNFLNQAILTDKINNYEKKLKDGIEINDRTNTKRTLQIILNTIDSLMRDLKKDIVQLDSSCNNRFKWMGIESLVSNPPDLRYSLASFYEKYYNTGIREDE